MRIKKAFTLAELMIVFIVIGIIIALGITSVKPWEKAYKYAYTRMYHTLALATYNHMINTKDASAFPTNTQGMCEALLEYINTSNNFAKEENQNKTIHEKSICKASTASNYLDDEPNEDTFRTKEPTIITSNNLYLWVAGKGGSDPFSITETEGSATNTVSYFIVYVDLNGERGKNTPKWSKDNMADVVAFAVTDKYAVIPLGYPMVDYRYLEANVVYPSINTDVNDTNEIDVDEDVISEAMTYYEAMVKAFATNTTDTSKIGKIQVSLSNVSTYLYDFNNEMNTGSKFFYVEDFNSHYDTTPEFDESNCALAENTTEPLCNVRIDDKQ